MMCLSGMAAAENAADVDVRFLTLANADDPMEEDEEPENLVKLVSRHNDNKGNNENGGVYTASNTSIRLVKEAAEALTEMLNDADEVGMTLYVRQGYRSYEDETKRYNRLKDNSSTQMPGQSDYQTGLGVTVVSREWRAKSPTAEFANTEEYQWLSSNCARYGFIFRYPEGKQDVTGWEWEPWHIRYVGREAAEIIRLNNLCLEEFVEGIGLAPDADDPDADDPDADDPDADDPDADDPDADDPDADGPDADDPDADDPDADGPDADDPDADDPDADDPDADDPDADDPDADDPDADDPEENESALAMPFVTPAVLPDGALILDETGPDGDNEIVLFHD